MDGHRDGRERSARDNDLVTHILVDLTALVGNRICDHGKDGDKRENDRHGCKSQRRLGIVHATEHQHLAHAERLNAQDDRMVAPRLK